MLERNRDVKTFSTQKYRKEHFRLLDEEWTNLIDSKTGLVYDNLVEEINCPVCGSESYKTIFIKKGLHFVRCYNPQCTHVFINPQLNEEVLNQHFRNSKAWEIWSKHVLTSEEQLEFDKKKFELGIDKITSLMENKTNLSILDVGCSSGVFLSLLQRKGWEAYGIEPSIEACGFAREHFQLNVFNGSFIDYHIKKKFDVITFWASLEYNKHVKNIIAKADNLLKPHGLILILISGNSHSLVMRALQDKCVGYLFNRCNSFNPQSLDYLLNIFQFEFIHRHSIIPETDVILNYLNYDSPYAPEFECRFISTQDRKQIKSIIERNHMGYKFLSIYRRKNG